MSEAQRFNNLLDSLNPLYDEYKRHVAQHKTYIDSVQYDNEQMSTSEIEAPLIRALETLETMESILRGIEGSFSDARNLKVDAMLAVVLLFTGSIHADTSDGYIDFTESRIYNLEKSAENLNKVLEFYKRYGVLRETILPAAAALVDLAKVNIYSEKYEKAIEMALQVGKLCAEFKATNKIPVMYAQFFGNKRDEERDPETQFNILQMKAAYTFAYLCKRDGAPREVCEQAVIHGIAAQDELLSKLRLNVENYNEAFYVILTFAGFLRHHEEFKCARYQMGAAQHVFDLLESTFAKVKQKNDIAKNIRFEKSCNKWKTHTADEWFTYCVNLLVSSERRQRKALGHKPRPDQQQLEDAAMAEGKIIGLTGKFDIENAKYTKIDSKIQEIVEEVPGHFITCYDDARQVFEFAIKWFDVRLDKCDEMEAMFFSDESRSRGRVIHSIYQAYMSMAYFAPNPALREHFYQQAVNYFENWWKKLDKKKHPFVSHELCTVLSPLIRSLRDTKYPNDQELTKEQALEKEKLTRRAGIYVTMKDNFKE